MIKHGHGYLETRGGSSYLTLPYLLMDSKEQFQKHHERYITRYKKSTLERQSLLEVKMDRGF